MPALKMLKFKQCQWHNKLIEMAAQLNIYMQLIRRLPTLN